MIDKSWHLIKNPWVRLPKTPPHILPEDLEVLLEHKIEPYHLGFKLEVLPVPYLGNLKKASVVLLCLNPGYKRELNMMAYKDEYCFKESIKSLTFSSSVPFMCLDPKLKYTGGYKWWTRLLRQLIRIFGPEKLSEKLMCLQYLAYHSKTFSKPPCVLPSQEFTFSILKEAMRREKTVVIMRSRKLWFEGVPELKRYAFIETKNIRMPYLSKGNMKEGNFERVVESIQK